MKPNFESLNRAAFYLQPVLKRFYAYLVATGRQTVSLSCRVTVCFWRLAAVDHVVTAATRTRSEVDDLGSFVRQRLEFVKRLYSKKHGIYRDPSPPIGGKVHVVGVGHDGGVAKYSKIR